MRQVLLDVPLDTVNGILLVHKPGHDPRGWEGREVYGGQFMLMADVTWKTGKEMYCDVTRGFSIMTSQWRTAWHDG